ncbi:hypothetical protein B4133_3214 [Bacillus altitudinis]|nr:hypothetical protein B4133_3214 [Bacillus altitudinis]
MDTGDMCAHLMNRMSFCIDTLIFVHHFASYSENGRLFHVS